MALFRKFFYRKPPDGLLEISDRVYVFNWCFTTDACEEDKYKVYVGGIIGQLEEHFPDAQLLVFNFREDQTKSLMVDILSEYDITIMDYPRHYEGCPLLTMEVTHHFLRSTENWLSLGHHNVLIMHCDRGGWPVLAFMLAALLIYRKQYSGEQKTLDMVYRQAPRELLHLLSPLNPVPSQLRYLQYISRRNVASAWPPLDRALTLDCIILRSIPNFNGVGGCRPIFRIYGQDPFLVSDRSAKVLYSTNKRSKTVRTYKQAECELIKIDINCYIQGDVVLECISLNDDMKQEEMMFRVVFNTAFIRSNILMLNLDEVDMLWDAKELFPKEFRAEILFSEMDDATSIIPADICCFDEEGLPIEAFAKVQEMFSHVDWLDHRADVAFNMLHHLSVSTMLHEKSDTASSPRAGYSPVSQVTSPNYHQGKTKHKLEDSTEGSTSLALNTQAVPSTKVFPDSETSKKEEEPQESKDALQLPSRSEVVSHKTPDSSQSTLVNHNFMQDSRLLVSGQQDSPQAVSGKPQLHDQASSLSAEVTPWMTASLAIPNSAPTVSYRSNSLEVKDVSVSPPTPPQAPPSRPSVTSTASKAIPPPPPPPELPSHYCSALNSAHSSLTKESKSHIQNMDELSLASSATALDTSSLGMTSSVSLSTTPAPPAPPGPASSTPPMPPPPPPPVSGRTSNASYSTPSPPALAVASSKTLPPPPTPPPPVVPLTDNPAVRAGPPPPPPPPLHDTKYAGSTVSSPVPPPPPPAPSLSNASPSPPPPPPPGPMGKGLSKTAASPEHLSASNKGVPPSPAPPLISPTSGKGRLLRSVNSRSHQTKKLKPLFWLKLSRAVSGSLWAETPKSGEASKAPEINMSELESLFSATVPNSEQNGKSGLRGSHGTKLEKVQLIEHRRAYNCEIMLSKVKIPLHDLLSSMLALEESAMDVDQVENLIKFCPTKEEMEQLKGYTGEKEKLGKCEQFLSELMQVPRVEAKLRVFSFKIQFHSQVSDLRSSLNIVNSVAEQIRSSAKLKRIMQTILSLGNALNQGTARGSAIGFRLDSLLKLTDTRARNNKMTLMHYLCKVLVDKLPELLDFAKDIASLEPASKIQLKFLAEEMQALSKGLEKVIQELSMSENDGPVSENFTKNLKEFLHYAEAEVRTLASLYSGVGRNVDALILYFGEDPVRCPFEQVISTLLNFVRMFNKAHEENCKQREQEMKKLAESEKSKKNSSHTESKRLTHPPIKSRNVK